MKGVIVQIGEPKSIALLNNGKIVAVPTPENCHLGMVVTVKSSNLLRIIIIILVGVLLIGLGIFIGNAVSGGHGHEHRQIYPPIPSTMFRIL
jgi:hypothetical protein